MKQSELVRAEQAARQKRFPPDRIAFAKQAAQKDAAALADWAAGATTFAWLRAEIAKNNYLDEYFPNGMIPEEMMKNELKIMGWSKRAV